MFCTKILTYLDLVYFLFIVLYYCYLISCILCVFHTIAENLHDNVENILIYYLFYLYVLKIGYIILCFSSSVRITL